jgi:uncharacterized protein
MKEVFKQIIKEFQVQIPRKKVFKRDLKIPTDSNKIIALIGTRRCGKTYYFYSMINDLLVKGIKPQQIIYINFEDERLNLKSNDLQSVLDAYYELYPANRSEDIYLFFDEIQEVENWEKFITRIYSSVSKKIFITGSSSKMLSSEIATQLRGRSISYTLYPLSLNEYCGFANISTEDIYSSRNRAAVQSAFNKYLFEGGYPETVNCEPEIQKKILQSYFDVMIFRDIVERYNIKNSIVLKRFIKQMMSTVSSEFSINKIYNDLKSNGFHTSKDKLYSYLEYCRDCFLFFVVHQNEISYRKQQKKNKKIYAADNGLLSAINYTFSQNKGKQLENLIFLHLIKRYEQVHYYHNGFECDFLIKENEQITKIIQVCYDISNTVTRKREIGALIKLSEIYPEADLLLLNSNEEIDVMIEENRIQIIPAWKWCLEI